MKPYESIFAASAERDFDRIAEHLFRSCVSFGERPAVAADRVDLRISDLWVFIQSLKSLPHRGTRRDDLYSGLRVLADQRSAAIAFEVDDDAGSVRILRIFYGGEDYETVMSE